MAECSTHCRSDHVWDTSDFYRIQVTIGSDPTMLEMGPVRLRRLRLGTISDGVESHITFMLISRNQIYDILVCMKDVEPVWVDTRNLFQQWADPSYSKRFAHSTGPGSLNKVNLLICIEYGWLIDRKRTARLPPWSTRQRAWSRHRQACRRHSASCSSQRHEREAKYMDTAASLPSNDASEERAH